jgi:type IV pilus assembly protein PilA
MKVIKFLNHLIAKKEDQGFTLIELLVVIIIIGILSAIALPSFLSQANKAKQSEAKTYVGAMNKGQQAYYTENSKFQASDISALGIGINPNTVNYTYTTAGTNGTLLSKATVGSLV